MGKGSSEELHLAALDVAVELVESGLVLPALEAATEEWSKHIDPSHLRYFAGEVLEVAGPPFGGRFAAAALRLLRFGKRAKGMTRASDEFLEQIKRQRARGAPAAAGQRVGRVPGSNRGEVRGTRRRGKSARGEGP